MNKISRFLRRCLFLSLLALMVRSDSTAQGFESRIVFASNRDGDWDIYSMDANGDNLVQLTDHPATDEDPACSPDGRRIVFRSERDLTPDLYVMDSDGSNVVRFTHDDFLEAHPSWTPDGTKFAFASFRIVVGNVEIYVMDAHGNNLINLTKHKWHDVRPSWSPDGRKIAFNSLRHFVPADSRTDIYVITADGKELEQLTDGPRGSGFPAYSPDGTKIAFASSRDGDAHIYLMDTNGRNAVKLTRTPAGIGNGLPSWLPGALVVNPSGKFPISWGELKRTRNP